MIQASDDTFIADRLNTLERGVNVLDTRVAALDDKVAHVIQMNSELMIQSNENFRDMRRALDDQRTELRKSIRQLKGNFSTKCQLVMFGLGLSMWTVFMAWVMWS